MSRNEGYLLRTDGSRQDAVRRLTIFGLNLNPVLILNILKIVEAGTTNNANQGHFAYLLECQQKLWT